MPGVITAESKPKLLDQMRNAIRLRQYSHDTERAYLHWAKRFILFHGKKHPLSMGKVEVEALSSHLTGISSGFLANESSRHAATTASTG